LRQDQIAQTQRLFQRDAVFLDIALCAIQLATHTPNCRSCIPLAHSKTGSRIRDADLTRTIRTANISRSPKRIEIENSN
jgi:hypothetical protein